MMMTEKQNKTYLVALTQEQVEWVKRQVEDAMEGAGSDGDEWEYEFLEGILGALGKVKERDPFVVELRLGSLEAKVEKLDRLVYKLYRPRTGKGEKEPQAA